MRTPKESANQAEESYAPIYRIPSERWNILEELLSSHSAEQSAKELNMLLIAGIKDAYYDAGASREEVVTLVYNLIRLVEVNHAIFDNGFNHINDELEEAV